MPIPWFRRPPNPSVLAQGHTEAAIAVLVAALGEERHRVRAALALLDRGWGRPRLAPERDPNPMAELSNAELAQAMEVVRGLVAQEEAARAAAAATDA